ncbi:hypothetical protein [Luteococcus sp. OSA5]|uniref:hypothetical protein n=1 Tax=Luteococcus sp. OSA5 TaxID=3401630 RepID=UPI003B42E29D
MAPQDTAIYEAHVKSLSAHPSSALLGVPDHLRGTYAGAALLAPHLKEMGFTTLDC